jgi:hypothetical protein
MKTKSVVINNSFGGFGLSPLGLKRYAELKGKECYFFRWEIKEDTYTPLTLEEATETGLFWTAFSIPNPNEVIGKSDRVSDGKYTEDNERYSKYDLNSRDIERDDPDLIKVIKELGKKANGICAELKIVKIPEDVEFTIEEYDGNEHIAESHRTWS